MSFRIVSRPIATKAKPVKAKPYLAWLHDLPCIVSGRRPVEAAHVSFANEIFGATGRGKSQKASDRWALPLCPDLHRDQHKTNEKAWWDGQGINPHLAAVVLWGLWCERKNEATEAAERLIANGLGRVVRRSEDQ